MGNKTRGGMLVASTALLTAAALAVGGSAAFAAGPSINDDYIDVDNGGSVYLQGGPDLYRIANKDRVLTSVDAAKASQNVWGKIAIIASSADYPDALAAAPLADTLDAPVLLNEPGDSLNPAVKKYLVDNNYAAVVLASGPAQLGEGITSELLDILPGINLGFFTTANAVVRIAGMNRYETAAALSVGALLTGDYADNASYNVFLADGQNFPDALSAGPAAANQNGVVLLTAGAHGIPSFTADLVEGRAVSWNASTSSWLPIPILNNTWRQNHAQNIAIGGAAKAAAAAGVGGVITEPIELTNSIVGVDRYATSVETAETYIPVGVGENWFAVASGEQFADAVVAGAWAANFDGALVLTKQAHLSPVTSDYLENNVGKEDGIVVFGGHGSVSPAVSAEIAALFVY